MTALDKLRSRLALLMVWGGWSHAKAQKHMDDARARTEFTAFDGTAAADRAELPKSIVNVGGPGSRHPLPTHDFYPSWSAKNDEWATSLERYYKAREAMDGGIRLYDGRIYPRDQYEAIRPALEAQRKAWEEAYEKKQRDDLHATIVQTLTRNAGLPTYELADAIVDAIEGSR